MSSIQQIPLRRRDGSVRAAALVDAVDAERLESFRWFVNNSGYAVRSEWDGQTALGILMHRQLLDLSPGDGLTVDHINRNKLDNRRANLRVVTHAQNQQNRDARAGYSSRFRSVYWSREKRRWRVRVGLDGRYAHVGYFSDEIEAAFAAEAWRAEHSPFAEPDSALVDEGLSSPVRREPR